MATVFIADAKTEERFALRVMMRDLGLEVVGEAADWAGTLTGLPVCKPEMLLVDWDLIPGPSITALNGLRCACPAALAIVLISGLEAHQQAAVSSGADSFISRVEAPDRVADRFLALAASLRSSPS